MNEPTPKAFAKADIAAVVAAGLIPMLALLWGMQPGNPYGYFVFLRIAVCMSAFVFVALFAGQKRETLVILFVGIMILFNPLFPIHLTRDKWLVIDALTIVFFVVGLGFWFAELRKKQGSNA